VVLRALVALALALSFLLTVPRVSAQTAADRRALIEQAQARAEAGDAAGAITLAERAQQIQASPSLAQFLAELREATGDAAGALADAMTCEDAATADRRARDRARLIRECHAMRERLEGEVGRVIVHPPSGAPSDLVIRVGGRVIAPVLYDVPAVVNAGEATVEATASGFCPFRASATIAVGAAATEVAIALRPDHPTACPADPTDAAPEGPQAHHLMPVRSSSGGGLDGFMPFAIGTAVATGVFLITAIALTAASDGRAQYYNQQCTADPTLDGCAGVLSEYNGEFDAAIAFWVLTGVAAAASGVLFVLELTRPHPAATAEALLSCGARGLGLACSF
jgi:hypothetical protein